ncbi:hypothetical protein CERSUDRAFT_79455 [Gelatoporia subvermispora B]|uniref:Hyaluronan/mRNA-binding protein domain-containing protein n=1 Tax=Ceriporiopsis subvermispora (strain B) TaxID=914234 RepID=M2RBJ7_CERS8|nr:hypothetical protein CERSUDRAFT_79455 [Gelatoporia subvermispora B]
MSVASKNPFALLEDETSSRPSTPVSKPAPAKDAAPAPAPATRGGQRGKAGPASRGGRYYQRGGKKPSSPQEKENQETNEETTDAPKKFEGEGRGRGRGRGRGDRARGRGRPFDKHSQTGKTDSDKKVHQGWGGDEGNTELKTETAAQNDATAEQTGDAWGTTDVSQWDAPATSGDAAVEAEKPAEDRRSREREVEEEDNTLTLDEYLKQRKGLEIVPQLETRKANEGDDAIWKDAVVVTKKDEDETAYFVGKTKSSAPKTQKKKEEKVFLEIDARFERPSRGGRGRGDRGSERGTRGGRGRGGNRGRANGSTAPALNVDDQTAFPSLS